MADYWISCARTMGRYLLLCMDSVCRSAGQAWCLENLQWFCLLLSLSINKPDPTNDANDSNCNCRNSSTCPMDGKCNDQNLIYQAEVTTPSSRETYIGLCDTTFKLRYRNHVCSFKNERYKHATELSKYIWSLKDKSISYNIKWRKVKQARSYSNVSKKCNLCLWEKYFIICKNPKCQHWTTEANWYLLYTF